MDFPSSQGYLHWPSAQVIHFFSENKTMSKSVEAVGSYKCVQARARKSQQKERGTTISIHLVTALFIMHLSIIYKGLHTTNQIIWLEVGDHECMRFKGVTISCEIFLHAAHVMCPPAGDHGATSLGISGGAFHAAGGAVECWLVGLQPNDLQF